MAHFQGKRALVTRVEKEEMVKNEDHVHVLQRQELQYVYGTGNHHGQMPPL